MGISTIINEQKVTVGDWVRVTTRLIEGDKVRLHPFEGVVIAIKGRGEGKTFTVRKIASASIGVERIWPVQSPWIEKITIKKQGKARRSKLYYLRQRKGRTALKVKDRPKVEEKTKPKSKKGSKLA